MVREDSQTPPFAAFAFKNDATGQVIIAYRGTDGLKDKATTVRTVYDADSQPGTPENITTPSALNNLAAAQSSALNYANITLNSTGLSANGNTWKQAA